MEQARKQSRVEADMAEARADRFWRFVGVFSAGLFALVIALTLLQCSIRKPEAPTWNSTLRIPLVADRFDAANLLLRLDNGDQLVNDDGSIGLDYISALDTVRLEADMTIPPRSEVVAQEVGQVNIGKPAGIAVTSDLAKFYSGAPGPIPPFDLDDKDTLGPLGEYTWLAPAYGELFLRVTNQFGLDFDSVTVTLADLAHGPLGTFSFPGGIPAGRSDSQAFAIGGRLLSNNFEYQLYAHCAGGTLFSLANRFLDVALTYSDTVLIDSALMEVPEVVRTDGQNLNFTGNADLVSIASADLAGGTLAVTVDNRAPLSASVTFAAPSFTLSGVPLSRNIVVPPHGSVAVNVDLAGQHWVPDRASPPQFFRVEATAVTVPSAPVHVLVRKSDSIIVTAELALVEAASVTGVLAPQRLVLPTFDQAISAPPELASFHLATAALDLEIVNGSGAQGTLDLVLSADNGKHVVIQGPVASGSAAAPLSTTFAEPNLAGFLDPLPGLVRLEGIATFGDSARTFTFTANDFARANVRFRAPLAARVDSLTIGGEIESQEITGSDVGEFIDRLEGGALHLEMRNHLPLGASVTLRVASDSARVFSAPDLVLGPVAVLAGILGPGGVVIDTASSTADLPLTAADLDLFRSSRLYFAVDFHLDGSGGKTVLLTAADYIDLAAYFTVTMQNGKGAW
jgi:hypothetical protein